MASLDSLPTEILHEVCTYLPAPSLVSFGATSRHHHAVSQTALQVLRLGIFPTRVHGLVSVLSASTPESPSQSSRTTNLVLPKSKSRTKDQVIRSQNRKAARILAKHGHKLKELDLALWNLEQVAADQIARCSRLQHLTLRLDHPHTRHKDLRASFWKEAAGSTVWNTFFSFHAPKPAASMDKKPAEHTDDESDGESQRRRNNKKIKLSPIFSELKSLTLERAGITDWQLQKLLQENPQIEELNLRKCTVLTEEFFSWLATSSFAENLRILHFESCEGETIDERILPHLEGLKGLETLSLSACLNIPNDSIKALAKESWPHLKQLTMPHFEAVSTEAAIEVDPAYK